MGRVTLEKICISFGSQIIVSDFDLDIQNGELVSLLGPSGVGKTTLLKVIAGLIRPDRGKVFIDGKNVTNLPAEKRETTMIFQKPLLFPFLNLWKNVEFGLKMTRIPKRERKKRIAEVLQLTGLSDLSVRKIHQLSGGQQQRAALARALVLRPSILLLDEPFSSLDEELRINMRKQLLNIQKNTGTTMLFITHDQHEALSMSDRICLLLNSETRQTGTAEELFYSPSSPETARFFDNPNLFEGHINGGVFHHTLFSFPAPGMKDGKYSATIRPENIHLNPVTRESSLQGVVEEILFEGKTTRLKLVLENGIKCTASSIRPSLQERQTVEVTLPARYFHIFPT